MKNVLQMACGKNEFISITLAMWSSRFKYSWLIYADTLTRELLTAPCTNYIHNDILNYIIKASNPHAQACKNNPCLTGDIEKFLLPKQTPSPLLLP